MLISEVEIYDFHERSPERLANKFFFSKRYFMILIDEQHACSGGALRRMGRDPFASDGTRVALVQQGGGKIK